MSYLLIVFYFLILLIQLVLHKYKGNKMTNGFILFLSLLFYFVFFQIIFEMNKPEPIADSEGRIRYPRNCLLPTPMIAIIFCFPGWFTSILTYVGWIIYTKYNQKLKNS